MPEKTPVDAVPLLIGSQVEAYALIVRRHTCDDLAAMLRAHGQVVAADLVEEDRDFTELSRSLAAVPKSVPEQEHAAGCRPLDCRCCCARAQDCRDCGRCVCWRAECCARVSLDGARRPGRTAALRRLLDGVGLAMLTEVREAAAGAEESALRQVVARRVRVLRPGDGRRYAVAVFEAVGPSRKSGTGHAVYSGRGVELYADAVGDPTEVVDLVDDAVLSQALGALAAMLRPAEGGWLTVEVGSAGDL